MLLRDVFPTVCVSISPTSILTPTLVLIRVSTIMAAESSTVPRQTGHARFTSNQLPRQSSCAQYLQLPPTMQVFSLSSPLHSSKHIIHMCSSLFTGGDGLLATGLSYRILLPGLSASFILQLRVNSLNRLSLFSRTSPQYYHNQYQHNETYA